MNNRKIIERGTVIKDGEKLTVRIARRAECGNCKACGMLGDHLDLVLDNYENAKKGDVVEIAIVAVKDRMFALIVYLMPILLMGLGLALGKLLQLADYYIVIIGFALLAGGLVGAYFIDKNRSKRLKLNPEIINIIKKGEE